MYDKLVLCTYENLISEDDEPDFYKNLNRQLSVN